MAGAAEILTSPTIKDVYQLMNCLVAGAIVYLGGRKAILAAIRSRAESVSKDLVSAREELARLTQETQRARGELSQLDTMKKKFVDEVREEGKRAYDQVVRDAQVTAERIISDATLAAENEVRLAAESLKKEVFAAAVAEAKKMALDDGGKLQRSVHENLVDRLIADLSLPSEGRGSKHVL